jgi:NAD dependent epimerase/dehydratase family enzyme
MPWIHIDDLVEAMLLMATNPDLSGPVNVSAPGEVTNLEFTKTLGRVLKRPTIFPVPRFMLRLLIGQFAEILVASGRVAPRRLLDVGFPFTYPDLESALRQLLGREESGPIEPSG